MAQDLGNRHAHAARVRHLTLLPVHPQGHREVVRVRDLVRGRDPRPERTERVDRLAEREHARDHLAPLDVAGGDVVEDHVPADVVHRLLGREPLPRLLQHDRELELVVELLGEVLGVHDGLLGPHDRVDVLEEHDPGRDLMRPVDLLRLLLVLAEVPRRVEELLRHDGRAEPRLGERHPLAGLVRAAPLEPLAHRRDVEHRDLLAVEHAHPPRCFAERHKLQLDLPFVVLWHFRAKRESATTTLRTRASQPSRRRPRCARGRRSRDSRPARRPSAPSRSRS